MRLQQDANSKRRGADRESAMPRSLSLLTLAGCWVAGRKAESVGYRERSERWH